MPSRSRSTRRTWPASPSGRTRPPRPTASSSSRSAASERPTARRRRPATTRFMLWADGYPTATSLSLQRLPGSSVRLDRGSFSGGDPHMALALEPDGRLWALWTKGGRLKAARSRTNGANFGATVSVPDPSGSTAYQLEALARPGSVDAFLNTGSTISRVRLLPGLTVHATRKVATVLDDHFPVKGATLKAGGRTLHTNGKGQAKIRKLKKHTLVRVRASGYTPTSFRVP